MKWRRVLVCAAICVFIVFALDTIPGIGRPHSTGGLMRSAAADTMQKEKVKEKVRETDEDYLDSVIKKKIKRNRPERKQDEPRYEQASEEKSSFWSSCLIDLLGSICSGMVSSALEGDDSESAPEVGLEEPVVPVDVVPETPSVSVPGAVGEDSPGTLSYTATVMPLGMEETTVLLWDRPGGEAMQSAVLDSLARAAVVDTLEMGAEVSVIQTSQIEDAFWVMVETLREPKKIGWIRKREISPIELPETKH